MTPEEQRIAIHESISDWRLEIEKQRWKTENLDFLFSYGVPDYLNDLNAMRDAEKTLQPDGFPKYIQRLQAITQSEHRFEVENRFAVCHATAAQRAESFLRATGRWKDK